MTSISERTTVRELKFLVEIMPEEYRPSEVPHRKADLLLSLNQARQQYWDTRAQASLEKKHPASPSRNRQIRTQSSLCQITAQEVNEWLRSLPLTVP